MDNHSSRRVFLGTGVTVLIGAIAGCSGENPLNNSEDIPEEWYNKPPFVAQLLFPTALTSDGTPFDPEPGKYPGDIYLGHNPKTNTDFDEQNLLSMVSGKAVQGDGIPLNNDEKEYWTTLPYRIQFYSIIPPEDLGTVSFEIAPRLLESLNTQTDTNSDSHLVNPTDMETNQYDGSTFAFNSSDTQKAENGLGYERDLLLEMRYSATGAANLLLPIDIEFTVIFHDIDYEPFSQTVKTTVVNHGNQDLEDTLDTVAKTWKTGRKAAGKLSARSTEKLYNWTKRWAAVQSGDAGGELKRDAVQNDIFAFKEAVSDRRFDRPKNENGKMGIAGPTIYRLPENPQSQSKPSKPLVDGRDFNLKEIREEGELPTGIRITHASSSTTDVPTENLELELVDTNADGVYPLSHVTDQQVSKPGDEYLFTEDTFGVNSLMDKPKHTITLWYTANGEWKWLTRSKTEPN